MSTVRWLLAWLAALAVATVLGSIVQTQFNLARIAALDTAIPWSMRLETTLFDLASFAPLWAVIVALGLLIALVAALPVARRLPRMRTGVFVLAGFLAVATSLVVMNAMLPVTPVGAARTTGGLLSMSLTGALAGWVHVRLLTRKPTRQGSG